MRRTALIRLAPTVSHKVVNSGAEPRTLYEDVQILPSGPPPAVCIDHNTDHKIGEVLKLHRLDDSALYPVIAPWLFAEVRLDDDAPDWIGKGVGCSISTKSGVDSDLFGWPVKRGAFLNEITICDQMRPREPLASVIYIEDEPKQTRTRTRTPAPLRTLPRPRASATKNQDEFAELRRRVDAALAINPHADVGLIITNLKQELGYDRSQWWQQLAI